MDYRPEKVNRTTIDSNNRLSGSISSGKSRTRSLLFGLVFILTAIISGIIGNRADSIINLIVSNLEYRDIYLYAISTVSLIVIALCLLLSLRYKAALEITFEINKIDEFILRAIASLYKVNSPQEKSQLARRIAKNLFRKILSISLFKNCGIAVYLRPEASSDYLSCWEFYSFPNDNDESLAFYVGAENDLSAPLAARGIVGTSFLTKKTLVVHLDRSGFADSNLFLGRPSRVGYRSLISIPILGSEYDKDSIGVLCFYSAKTSSFDKASVRPIAESLAIRFSAILTE